ncbi:uncharacterized protein LOC119385764 [Rhipicephalus sanguineus]|uniref:uncharacterized protein LOC119385764 n=1 Tax=Rhipicephalus sanguineus TaxID=34632 RepID=UPI0020C1CB6E|nr:uncharacterized protein LOC119385764 [Rhipicephalus sanguineus]
MGHSGPNQRNPCCSGYGSVKTCSSAMRDLCGVTLEIYAVLFALLPIAVDRSCDASMNDRLLLFLMKLKLGIGYPSLTTLFSVSRMTAARHFNSVLRTLAAATEKLIFVPPRHIIRSLMPNGFKAHYSNCIMIIDCTEVPTEQPASVAQQRALYTNCKGGYTLKFLVTIIPNGAVCFHSKAYGGKCFDALVTVHSDFLKEVEPGDMIMADKGFPGITTDFGKAGAVFVMPPLLRGQGQFTEADQTYNIARVGIHAERMIQRIKMYNWPATNVLNTRVPIEGIPAMSDVFHVCCVLANMQTPILKEPTISES